MGHLNMFVFQLIIIQFHNLTLYNLFINNINFVFKVWALETSLPRNPDTFIEVHLTVQESERSIMYVCARGFDISTFHDFDIGFWKGSDEVVMFAFHFSI
jgi:hypothetical protein